MLTYLIGYGEDGDIMRFEHASEDVHEVLSDFKKEYDPNNEEVIHIIYTSVDVTPKDMTPYNPKPKDEVVNTPINPDEVLDKLPSWWDTIKVP